MGIAFPPDGSQIVTTSYDRTVRLWEINIDGHGFDPQDSTVYRSSVAYSPDGRFLCSGKDNGVVEQHDADTGEPGFVFSCPDKEAENITYSPDGLRIAACGEGGDITLWDVQTCTFQSSLHLDTQWINGMVYSSNEDWIALSTADKEVFIWDARSMERRQTLCGFSERVGRLAFSLNGLDIAVGCMNGDINIFELSTGERKVVMRSGTGWIYDVAYLPGSAQVVSTHGQEGARLWDERGKDSKDIFKIDHPNVGRLAFSNYGQWAVTVDALKAHVWRSSSLEETPQDWSFVTTVEGCFGHIRDVAWRPSKLEFATASADGSTRVWRVVEAHGNVSVQLAWSCGNTALAASGIVLAGTVGLSPINRRLLEQRGAVAASSPQDDKA